MADSPNGLVDPKEVCPQVDTSETKDKPSTDDSQNISDIDPKPSLVNEPLASKDEDGDKCSGDVTPKGNNEDTKIPGSDEKLHGIYNLKNEIQHKDENSCTLKNDESENEKEIVVDNSGHHEGACYDDEQASDKKRKKGKHKEKSSRKANKEKKKERKKKREEEKKEKAKSGSDGDASHSKKKKKERKSQENEMAKPDDTPGINKEGVEKLVQSFNTDYDPHANEAFSSKATGSLVQSSLTKNEPEQQAQTQKKININTQIFHKIVTGVKESNDRSDTRNKVDSSSQQSQRQEFPEPSNTNHIVKTQSNCASSTDIAHAEQLTTTPAMPLPTSNCKQVEINLVQEIESGCSPMDIDKGQDNQGNGLANSNNAQEDPLNCHANSGVTFSNQGNPQTETTQPALQMFLSWIGYNSPKAYHHIDVQFPANWVELCVYDRALNKNVYHTRMEKIDDSQLHWRTPAFKNTLLPNQFIFHIVNPTSDNITYSDIYNDKRWFDATKSSYSVFRFPKYNNDFATGRFWFAQYVYSRLCSNELSLEDALQEYDRIAFGHNNFPRSLRENVASWIQDEIEKSSSDKSKVLFFGHAIQHFDKRLLQKDKKSTPLLKQLLERQNVITNLLNVLYNSTDNELSHVTDYGSLIASLLCLINTGEKLGILVAFVSKYGAKMFSLLSNCKFKWSEKDVTFLKSDFVYTILKNSAKFHKSILEFVLKRAESPLAVIKLQEALNDVGDFPQDLFKKNLKDLLSSKNLAKPVVIDKAFWSSIPDKYKSELLEIYVKLLNDKAKDLCFLDEEQAEAVKNFFTDEIALQCDLSKCAFLNVIKNPALSIVAVDILKDSNFRDFFWKGCTEDVKKEVYSVVLSSVSNHQHQGNHVNNVYQYLHNVFVALDVCPLESARQNALTQSKSAVCTADIKTIVEAYNDIQGLHHCVVDEYNTLLQESIEKMFSQGPDVLVGLMCNLDKNDETQKGKIKRVSTIVFKCLCTNLKIPSSRVEIEKLGFSQSLKNVLTNQRMWSELLSIWIPHQSIEHNTEIMPLKLTLDLLVEALQVKAVKICDIKRFIKDSSVDLLEKLISLFDEKRNNIPIRRLLESCYDQATETFGTLERLINGVKSVKSFTDGIVYVSEMDDILVNLKEKKDTFEEKHFREVLDDDFLAIGHLYLMHLDDIEDLMCYKVFKNIAKQLLDDMHEREICDTSLSIIEMLIKRSKKYLQGLCLPLFSFNAGSMEVRCAEMLLKGVGDDTLQSQLDFIEKCCGCGKVEEATKEILMRFVRFPQMQKNLEALTELLKLMLLDFSDNTISNFFTKKKDSYHTISELYEATDEVIDVEKSIHGSKGDVISELSVSKELVKLLKETAKDDVRNLIDAVEEHSDTTVRAKEVSDFIEIHKLFSPVFSAKPQDFLEVLMEKMNALNETEASQIAARIKSSGSNAYSLRNIYKNVANRGEMTKEIVAAALDRGMFHITNQDTSVNNNKCKKQIWKYSLSYSESPDGPSSSIETTHSMERLQDIKSRALLIVNSEMTQQDKEDSDVDFQSFIDQVELLNDIVVTGEGLQQSGHVDFEVYFCKCSTLAEIKVINDKLRKELQNWKEIVKEAKKEHLYLNFFHPNQLWTIKEYFNGNKNAYPEALSLLRFVDNTIQMDDLHMFKNDKAITDGQDKKKQLLQIGLTLKSFFDVCEKGPKQEDVTSTKHGLSVAVLEKGSTQTTAVVMKLFKGIKMQHNQVLFCHGNSTWDEIELFLRRCFLPENANVLHCLANVESLDIDIQFLLIDAIRAFQAEVQNYWLVLICCGGEHHHVVNQFQENKKRLRGMTDEELKKEFLSKFPNVSVVTSDLPGLGKTEQIWQSAGKKQRRLVSFPVNGPVDRRKLLHRLLNLGLDKDCFLHIDVSEVDDPLSVDTFLFELIVLGMVTSSTLVFHCPTYFISIEIANTLDHHLRDSLVITKCFQHSHVQWDDFGSFVCSQEKKSALQIVCHYLQAHERGDLEKESLSCKDLKKGNKIVSKECRRLIKKYSPWENLSYNTVEIFLNVLAVQLRRYSSSPFFRPENLSAAVKETSNIRQRLFEALMHVSIEFAQRSVGACKEVQTMALRFSDSAKSDASSKMVDRVQGMVRWAEDNHLIVMFQEANSISALFRELDKVPQQVQELFKSQNAPLKDLDKLSEKELEEKLKKILIIDSTKKKDSNKGYVLTPDNVLKMVLIVQRIRAQVPVIVMGETGCGKTSLIRYLAKCCDVEFSVMNFHAGIYEEDIIEFTRKQIEQAEKHVDKQLWVFFDEINTCDYLGLINDIICHRSLNGEELPPNLVFLAACNPYCLRSAESISTAGLTGKSLSDEYSKLVYRVKPLPETMMDYVWDYGSLDPQDEKLYISRMVNDLNLTSAKLLEDLLATSQEFIRNLQSRYSVSLRDVRRCIRLIKWFFEIMETRPAFNGNLSCGVKKIVKNVKSVSPIDKSIILALAHSYQSRIPSSQDREKFREELQAVYHSYGNDITASNFNDVVRAEQEEILARMELPDGTAKNTALRENVFVILVCILNRIPVFVVGKPGCSKSLSMQVIISNLRGKDSKDDFFKTLPQLLVVSYQGSESSTSEGILKVFEKAQKYKDQNKQDNISLPVVLLDEVGLAEISKYNPLKVLHRLLEPEEKELPDVAVVGISNWALDAAKMNRAIHLSRPEPTLSDLQETGMSILEAQSNALQGNKGALDEHALQGLQDDMLICLAKTYFEYQSQQQHENFHGLRDYYSLIKCLSQTLMSEESGLTSTVQAESTFRSLQRNFGGIPKEDQLIEEIYVEKVKSVKHHDELDKWKTFPVTELIAENLRDPNARHLMLITSGHYSLSIVDDTLSDVGKEKVVIFGSNFEEDQSEEYSYRTLSRIILYMERECVLVLKDLENVYGSLYDMLNQNYVVVGRKKNCRVALGPYSNPMCQVNDGFRCVVLVDEKKVDYADPPFLNRFEKQLLRYTDVLKHHEFITISSLETWVNDFCMIEGQDFKDGDVFLGLQPDSLASLALFLGQEGDGTSHLLRKCKEKILDIATPDGVLRSLCSNQFKKDPREMKELFELYLKKPLHKGLKGFLEFHQDPSRAYFIVTHASIHIDIASCIKGFSCQVEKLGSFKSERQLSKAIQQFWMDSNQNRLLVFQCKPDLDGEHMLLLQSLLEQNYETYLKKCKNNGRVPEKSVSIIVHLERGGKSVPWQLTFTSTWLHVTIDSLEEPEVPITKILGKTVHSLFKENVLSFKKIMGNELMWCFTRLKYPNDSDSNQKMVNDQIEYLKSSDLMVEYLNTIVMRWIGSNHTKNNDKYQASLLRACEWQVDLACDKKALLGTSSLSDALMRYVNRLVRSPLAKAIFLIEDRLSLECCRRALSKPKYKDHQQKFIANLITDKDMFNINDVPDPHEANCYELTKPGLISQLNFPFTLIFNGKIEELRDSYISKSKDLEKDDHQAFFFQELLDDILEIVPQISQNDWLTNNLEQYVEDVIDFATSKYSSELTREERLKIMKAICSDHLQMFPDCNQDIHLAQIYFFLWKHESDYLSMLLLFACIKKIFDGDLGQLTHPYINHFRQALPMTPREEIEDEDVSCSDDDSDEDDLSSTGSEYTNSESSDDDITSSSSDEESEDSDDDDDISDEDEQLEEICILPNKNNNANIKTPDISNDNLEDECSSSHVIDLPDQEYAVSTVQRSTHDDKPNFLEMFFDEICESLLPKKKLIEKKLDGVKKWQALINAFISHVAKSELNETLLYVYLRVCSDFTNLVLDPHCIDNPNSLYMLSEIYYKDDNHGDLQYCFDELLDLTDNLDTQTLDVEKFRISFLTRCLQTCDSEAFFEKIVCQVCSFKKKDAIQLASPLISNTLQFSMCMADCDNYDYSFNAILDGNGSDCPSFQVLDGALNDAVQKSGNVLDCHFVTAFLDALNRSMPGVEIPEEVDSSTCAFMTCLRNAFAIVKEPRNKQNMFMFLCAISYIRSLLSSFAELICESPSILITPSSYSNVLEYLNSIFETPSGEDTLSPRKASILLYFLRELKRYYTWYELRQVCEQATQLPILPSLKWNDKLSSTAFCMMTETVDKQRVKNALQSLLSSAKSNSSQIHDICKKLSAQPKLRKVFALVMLEDLYLSHRYGDIVDKAKDVIVQLLPRSLPGPYYHLILCLTGKQDLDGLTVTPELRILERPHITIVLHLAAILTAEIGERQAIDRPFFSYLLDPMKACKGCILADSDQLNQEGAKDCSIFMCNCKTVFARSDEEKCCPLYRKNCSKRPLQVQINQDDISKGTLCVGQSKDDEFTVCNMTPSSFRILHMFVHSALAAGLSMGKITSDTLAKVLSIESSNVVPMDCCIEEIENDLNVLGRLWSCSEENLLQHIHEMMENLSSFITKHMGSPLLSDDLRKKWQKEFTEQIKRFHPPQSSTVFQGADLSSLEACIGEQDITDDDTKDHNAWTPRLFRFTKEETLDDFSSKYHLSSTESRRKHPLIGLLLKNLNILPKIAHLFPLLHFPKLLDQYLGRRLNRQDSKKFIEDVIKGNSYVDLKSSLGAFCNAWEAVREDVKKHLGKDVPHLSETSQAAYFIIDQGPEGMYLQCAINILQELQNVFLAQVLNLAVEDNCKALDFLRKSESTCTMPIVHIQDATKEEIIQFEWDDAILLHSYNNTDYGKGSEISYDFETIERVLAGKFLLNKVYLGDSGGLRCFPYSNELFHSSTNVLNEVCKCIPQESIDANMENKLNLIKEKNLQNIQVLLEHLEVIICWLSKTSRLDPHMPLVEYVERKLPKSNLLPEKIFQDKSKEFRICHAVSTYHKLEEIFSAVAANNVSDEYRSTPNEKQLEWMKKVTENIGDNIDKLTIVLTTLRRFIFRYLLSEKKIHWFQEPHKVVVKQLDDPSLWPLSMASSDEDGTPMYKELIHKYVPESMMAGDVHSVMAFYDNFLKERNRSKELPKKLAVRKNRSKMAPNFKSRFA